MASRQRGRNPFHGQIGQIGRAQHGGPAAVGVARRGQLRVAVGREQHDPGAAAAATRCIGPVSLPIATRARAAIAATSMSAVRPVRSTAARQDAAISPGKRRFRLRPEHDGRKAALREHPRKRGIRARPAIAWRDDAGPRRARAGRSAAGRSQSSARAVSQARSGGGKRRDARHLQLLALPLARVHEIAARHWHGDASSRARSPTRAAVQPAGNTARSATRSEDHRRNRSPRNVRASRASEGDPTSAGAYRAALRQTRARARRARRKGAWSAGDPGIRMMRADGGERPEGLDEIPQRARGG